ncbi:MAG: hypothetical protein KAI71_02935 [Candidatus Pacebacteria bacterium]|nr:hypothetical protein [Candidatus Paceibacterota bacterium]
MKIDITKEQYESLIIMNGIASSVLGTLGDSMPDTNYEKRTNEMEEIEEYFLQYAEDFGCEKFTEDYKGKKVFEEEMHEKHIMTVIDDYDQLELFNGLANKLAWRDFRRDHSKKEIEKMSRKNGDYFGPEIHSYEKKYWDEFKKYEYERLEIEK